MHTRKKVSYVLAVSCLLWAACNASDSVSHYESGDSVTGPRISKEHLEAPPVKDTVLSVADTARDSLSRRSISPPGETDTTKLKITEGNYQ